MGSKSKSLLIAIPAFNEEKIINKTSLRVISEIKKLNVKTRLLIINDGSTDNTANRVIKLKTLFPRQIDLVNHIKNKGYGGAIQSGIKYAFSNNFDYILFMDSDLTNDPKDIKRFAEAIRNDYDCVKASRYISSGKTINVPLKRVLLSRGGNLIASLAFNVGIKDCTNGFQMIKVKKLKNVKLHESGFSVIMELMYFLKKRNAKFSELPVTLTNRKTGTSTFHYSFKTFYNYLKFPIKSIWV